MTKWALSQGCNLTLIFNLIRGQRTHSLLCTHRSGLYKLIVTCHLIYSACLKNLYNHALTLHGWNSSWSFLRSCSWVIILYLTEYKLPHNFIHLTHLWTRQWHPTHAWKIPWTEEPGGLQSMGSLRVRHH